MLDQSAADTGAMDFGIDEQTANKIADQADEACRAAIDLGDPIVGHWQIGVADHLPLGKQTLFTEKRMPDARGGQPDFRQPVAIRGAVGPYHHL
ncbi:hypothetical protein D9M72_621480 [compost metagenome]